MKKIKLGPIAQFILIGAAVGIVAPFFLSLCLFGTTLQVFMVGEPTPGFWSGAPTPQATAVPGHVQVAASKALGRGGGSVFVLWSLVGAYAGEAIGNRWTGHPWHKTRRAWLGAALLCVIFNVVAMWIFLP